MTGKGRRFLAALEMTEKALEMTERHKGLRFLATLEMTGRTQEEIPRFARDDREGLGMTPLLCHSEPAITPSVIPSLPKAGEESPVL
jgi:hypothetical protein